MKPPPAATSSAAEQPDRAGGRAEPAPPSAGAPRQMPAAGIWAVGMAGFCAFLALYATQPILPLLESLFHVSKAEAGLTVSASTLAVALAAPLIGAVADRAARKRVITLSILALAIPAILTATAHSFAELMVWRFLQGAVVPGVYAVAIAYITEEAGGSSVGTVMAALITGSVIGGFVGRMTAGVVTSYTGWRVAFLVLGGLTMAGGLVTWRWMPPSQHFTPRCNEPHALREARPRLRAPRLIATYAIGFNVLFALVATFTYVTFYLGAPPFSMGPAALSGIFVVYLVGAVITPAAGRWIDRAGSSLVLTVGMLAGAAGMLLTLIHVLAAVLVGLTICCTAAFIGQSAATSYLRIAAPAPVRSLASGVYITCYYLGGSVGGLLPGLLWRYAGWGGCVALVIAAQIVTAVVGMRFMTSDASA